jgi:hypothetical protein
VGGDEADESESAPRRPADRPCGLLFPRKGRRGVARTVSFSPPRAAPPVRIPVVREFALAGSRLQPRLPALAVALLALLAGCACSDEPELPTERVDSGGRVRGPAARLECFLRVFVRQSFAS